MTTSEKQINENRKGSRRYGTRERHEAAKAAKLARWEAQAAEHAANAEARKKRTPEEQLALIAKRRGNSSREKARLQIASRPAAFLRKGRAS
jgi:hypothetical protein